MKYSLVALKMSEAVCRLVTMDGTRPEEEPVTTVISHSNAELWQECEELRRQAEDFVKTLTATFHGTLRAGPARPTDEPCPAERILAWTWISRDPAERHRMREWGETVDPKVPGEHERTVFAR